MKKIFNILLAMLAMVSVACTPDNEGEKGKNSTTFTIEVSKTASIEATIEVFPSNKNATYYYTVESKADFDKYANAKECATKRVADLKEACENYGWTVEEFLSKGDKSFTRTGLLPTTEYCAVVFGVTTDGATISDVTTALFTTSEEVIDPSLTFDIEVSDIMMRGATVKVAPSNNAATYYFDVVSKEEYDSYADGREYANETITRLKRISNDLSESFTYLLSLGTNESRFDAIYFHPNTEYYAIAFGVAVDGTLTTNVATKTFTTLESQCGDKELIGFSSGYCADYGDYYEVNARNWYLLLDSGASNEEFVFEVQTSLNATDITGTYQFASTMKVGTAITGYLQDNYMAGSYWCQIAADGYSVQDYSFITSGSVTISKTGDNYTIVVDAVDEHGHKITVDYKGALEMDTNASAAYLSAITNSANQLYSVPNSFKRRYASKISMIKCNVARYAYADKGL
ncbi:MAG: hypothetical protein II307_01055 [Alistipes sp.]|nr:hypothetical protein [Alistipes sp.]